GGFSARDAYLGNSSLFQAGGLLGQGTNSPRDVLHIAFTDTGGYYTGLAVQNLSGAAGAYSGMLFLDQTGAVAQFQGFTNIGSTMLPRTPASISCLGAARSRGGEQRQHRSWRGVAGLEAGCGGRYQPDEQSQVARRHCAAIPGAAERGSQTTAREGGSGPDEAPLARARTRQRVARRLSRVARGFSRASAPPRRSTSRRTAASCRWC